MNKRARDFIYTLAQYGQVTTSATPMYLTRLIASGFVVLVSSEVEYWNYTSRYTWALTEKGKTLVAHPSWS